MWQRYRLPLISVTLALSPNKALQRTGLPTLRYGKVRR